MKTTLISAACVAAALLFGAAPIMAQEVGDDLRETRALPSGELRVESHIVSIDLAPGFATTTVDQILINPKPDAVSAQWNFPLPEEAALSELSVLVGGKRLEGEVVEKKEAREILQKEAEAGNTAALAEQDGFIDYRVELTKVPAGDRVEVRLVYIQPVRVDGGVGRFAYPLREGNTRDEGPSSVWNMERKVHNELRFDVTLRAAFPVAALGCQSHSGFQATADEEGVWRGNVAIPGATFDRDFVLYWRLAEDTPARVELLTHRRPGADEGTFLAVVTPGADLAPIEGGTDWAFVLDVSGSMEGEKIRVLQRGVERAIEGLQPEDRVMVASFSNTAKDHTRGFVELDAEGVDRLQGIVRGLSTGGGTNVFDGIECACRRLDADRPTGIILVSDGVANTGPHEYRDLIKLTAKYDLRLFTFVIGNGANTPLLGDLATLSGGHAVSISTEEDVAGQLLLAQSRMSHQALHGTELSLDNAVAQYPEHLPSLYLGQQLVVFGRYDQPGESTLRVSAKISGERVTWELPVNLPDVDESVPEIERLYALAAIGDLQREAWLDSGDEGESRDAVLDLALRYSLVTDYSSMIVVEDGRKAQYGIGNANAQRRAEERAAAEQRVQQQHRPQVATGSRPLGGDKAEHAPSRRSRRGSGAVGPFYLLAVAGLGAAAALRRRKRK